jgi:signal transduction histidine kinase
VLCRRIWGLACLVETLFVNFAEAFSEDQLAEIRIVLDQLRTLVGEDKYLDEATREKLDQLAQAVRENDECFHVPEHDPHRDYVAEMHDDQISGPDAR